MRRRPRHRPPAATAHVAGRAAHAAAYAVTNITDAAVPTDSTAATAKEHEIGSTDAFQSAFGR